LKDGEPLSAGQLLRNPDLADLLSALADRNSADSFYRGDVARRMAKGFQKNGGLVTVMDLAAYQARDVVPLGLKWNQFDIHTAPLTAGGLTVLGALAILQAMPRAALDGSAGMHARLEAMRLAWKDRLELLGDPEQVKVPVLRLLSADYARELAVKVQSAVKARQPVPIQIRTHPDEGTCNLCSVDRSGNLAAVTFTQGSDFGAQVTVDGLGLTLGHGMSRFNPRPDHPNAPGPGKRPLHNMCPTALLRDGKPVLALGGTGGVRIPSAVYDVLNQLLLRDASLEAAIAAPRAYCTGTLEVIAESSWPKADAAYLQQVGFQVQTADNAVASAVSFDPSTGECGGSMR
jgi:gamma-glutamyltranspeptidase/glutathione hydrolase